MHPQLRRVLPLVDVVAVPLVLFSALILIAVRRLGVQRVPLCRSILMRVGVFPIRRHYHEPQFDNRSPRQDFAIERDLPGIDLNEAGQLEFLEQLTYAAELADLPLHATPGRLEFYLNNASFTSGDAEYLYQVIRAVRPQRILEVGSGNSTLMAVKAVTRNASEDASYRCQHVCIEPYEMPWLEKIGVTVLRQRVEEVEASVFSDLDDGDLLFIDSSHVIRPDGDVLFEFLQLLPILRPGVIVHVHDIFTPRNYRKEWLVDEVRLWNEQYLLEAFLTNNREWEVIGALNYLHHNHFARLKEVAPFSRPEVLPGSFYMRRVTRGDS